MVTTVASQSRSTLAIVSVVAGVLSLVLLTFVAFIALILAVVAIVTGTVAAKRGAGGLPLHYIGIVLGLVAIVLFVVEVA
jgi:hypothetical protein